jgi:hypothetical protein
MREMRYQDRRFAIQGARKDAPDPGFAAEVWELTGGGQVPITGLLTPVVLSDSPSVLAFAVCQIVEAIDQGRLPVPSFEPDRGHLTAQPREAAGSAA